MRTRLSNALRGTCYFAQLMAVTAMACRSAGTSAPRDASADVATSGSDGASPAEAGTGSDSALDASDDAGLDARSASTGGATGSGSGGSAVAGTGGVGSGGAASGGTGVGSGGRGSGGSGARGGSGGATSTGSGSGGNGSGGSGSGGSAGGSSQGGAGAGGVTEGGRGFPIGQPWVAFYGSPTADLDLAKLAATFRIIDLDADPDVGFTTAQIAQLRSSGQNRVISYLDVGSCESFRSYYATAPAGHKSCQSSGALTGAYAGYSDEMWADLSNASYQDLIVNYVAPRLAAQGVDGFFLDNMEVVEHGLNPSQGGPCDTTCSQGGLDLIWQLRQKFPDKLLVLQNAVSATTRMGTTNGVAFPTLLDGISVESTFSNGTTVSTDTGTLNEVLAWRDLGLTPGNRPFWLGAEDYVGACNAANKPTATAIYSLASAAGLNEYATDMSGLQHAPCYWSDFP